MLEHLISGEGAPGAPRTANVAQHMSSYWKFVPGDEGKTKTTALLAQTRTLLMTRYWFQGRQEVQDCLHLNLASDANRLGGKDLLTSALVGCLPGGRLLCGPRHRHFWDHRNDC